ncbi:MAG TPA: HipA N-terminal domain-containing protein [Pirellulales bacterium]|nr:HipA N-terminal domain-containing protein [Pirellulales bacterium]
MRRRAGISETKAAAAAAFELRYAGLRVGTLTCRDGKWTFWYSEQFRHRPDLRPLVQFADVNRVYRSDRLWPFFLLRIPSMSQSDVQDALKHEHIDATDEVALLRRFGKRTIANPFELVEVEAGDVTAPPSPSKIPKVPEPMAS